MVMRLSDYIEEFIRESLKENNGIFEFNRNSMANDMNCVPSQISYVVATRFNNDNGYLVTSRRGGKGSIEIRQLFTGENEQLNLIEHLLDNVPNALSEHDLAVYLDNLLTWELISEREKAIALSLMSDNSMLNVPIEERKEMRANMLTNLLRALANEYSFYECQNKRIT